MAVTSSSATASVPSPLARGRRWSRELTELTSSQRWTLGACGVATALFLTAGLPSARTVDDAGISGTLEPVGAAAVDVAPPAAAPAPALGPPPAAPLPAPSLQPAEPAPAEPTPADRPPGQPTEPSEPAEPSDPSPLSVLPVPIPLP